MPYKFDYSKYDRISNFMYDAMMTDSNSPEAKEISDLRTGEQAVQDSIEIYRSGTYPPPEFIASNYLVNNVNSYAKFGEIVTNDTKWDYKHKLIASGFFDKAVVMDSEGGLKVGSTVYVFPIVGDANYLYYHDLWGNIHYGYVGRFIGFTEKDVLYGSALNNVRNQVSGSSARDDQLSVQIGVDLYDAYGEHLSLAALTDAIFEKRLDYTEDTTRIRPSKLKFE